MCNVASVIPTADTLGCLPYAVHSRPRHSMKPDLRLTMDSTREDVLAVYHLLAKVQGFGPAELRVIDLWLAVPEELS